MTDKVLMTWSKATIVGCQNDAQSVLIDWNALANARWHPQRMVDSASNAFRSRVSKKVLRLAQAEESAH
jgi:hypothetical protein